MRLKKKTTMRLGGVIVGVCLLAFAHTLANAQSVTPIEIPADPTVSIDQPAIPGSEPTPLPPIPEPVIDPVPDPIVEPPSLKGVRAVAPDLSEFIADLDAARQLGKALFWDTQVGSDGNACASCHFHAGADIRTKHEVDPGIRGGDNVFDAKATIGSSGPNKQLVEADFPFHQLGDTTDRESPIRFDTNDVFSSIGTFAGDFVSSRRPARPLISTKVAASTVLNKRLLSSITRYLRGDTTKNSALRTSEVCSLTYAPYSAATPTGSAFHANGLIYRKVEPRQTPTTVNAVFNRRQFWDGRANNEFNGVDPFGPRTYAPAIATANGTQIGNPAAAGTGIFVANATTTVTKGQVAVSLVQPLIRNASLASQAVGPPLSDFEMSCSGKGFPDLGRKVLPMKALSTQLIDPTDSLFSKTPKLVNKLPIPGLNATYVDLVKKAFKPKYWSAAGNYLVDPATGAITRTPTGDSQIEHNFSLFWGLAIQAYESILVSDDAPYDRGPAAMTEAALKGKDLFMGKGKCIACHSGPLFSSATTTTTSSSPESVEGMTMGDGKAALYDGGFYNIGVRATKEDVGVGGFDPYNFDLSFSRQYKWRLLGVKELSPDHFDPNPCQFAQQLFDCHNPPTPADPTFAPRDAVDGAFKVPILRNVGLSPPYFHNGGQATLKDVVRFYNRGGDRRGQLEDDTSGLAVATPFGAINKSNLDADIGDASNVSRNNALGLSEVEMDSIVEFLLSLTDQRVACHSDVFDHPALPLVVGHQDTAKAGTQRAKDNVVTLPAVGKQGLANCFPNSGSLFGSLQTSFARIAK